MTQPGKVAVFQLPGEGEALATPAGTVVVKVDSEQTAGTMTLLEYDIAAGAGGPPVHVHPSFDELFYVVQGEIEFRAGEESVRAPAGSTFFTPGTEPHTFSNLDGPPARLLVVALPGGFEAFFREMAALADADELDRDAVLALNAKHGVTTA